MEYNCQHQYYYTSYLLDIQESHMRIEHYLHDFQFDHHRQEIHLLLPSMVLLHFDCKIILSDNLQYNRGKLKNLRLIHLNLYIYLVSFHLLSIQECLVIKLHCRIH